MAHVQKIIEKLFLRFLNVGVQFIFYIVNLVELSFITIQPDADMIMLSTGRTKFLKFDSVNKPVNVPKISIIYAVTGIFRNRGIEQSPVTKPEMSVTHFKFSARRFNVSLLVTYASR